MSLLAFAYQGWVMLVLILVAPLLVLGVALWALLGSRWRERPRDSSRPGRGPVSPP